MLFPLDGPSTQLGINVTTGTVLEAKVSTNPLSERKAVTLQPLTGDVYVHFSDLTGSTPSVATVQADGVIIYEGSIVTLEATETQRLFLLAVSATTKTIVIERS